MKVIDHKFWHIGKVVYIIDSKHIMKPIKTYITKIGRKYVTALGKRFYVMGTGLYKQIGSAKINNPLVLFTDFPKWMMLLSLVGCSALDNFEVPMCNGAAGFDTCPDGVCVAGRCTTKCEVDEDCHSFCCKETEDNFSACAEEIECR